MTWESAFLALNMLVVPGWALLVFLPRAAVTKTVVHSALYPVALGLIYVICLVAALAFGQSTPTADMTSLAGIMALFAHPNGVMTGWTHYLVFDLFIGAWIARDAQRRGVPHLAAVPCMLLTFIFGPVGLLLYLLLRAALRKGGLALFETQAPSPPASSAV
jgi:hypothetical protein